MVRAVIGETVRISGSFVKIRATGKSGSHTLSIPPLAIQRHRKTNSRLILLGHAGSNRPATDRARPSDRRPHQYGGLRGADLYEGTVGHGLRSHSVYRSSLL